MKMLLICVMLIMMGFSCSEVGDFPLKEGQIRKIEFSGGGAFSGFYTFTVSEKDITFESNTYVVREDEYKKNLTRRRKLSEKEAIHFWSEVDRLKISTWKKMYKPEDVNKAVMGGALWSVELTLRGKVTRSKGTAAFPSVRNVKVTTIDSSRNRYRELNDQLFSYFPEG